MKVDPPLAKDVKELAAQLSVSPQELLASLVWIAKKAMGRKVKIESKAENKTLTITAFEDCPPMSPLVNDDANGK